MRVRAIDQFNKMKAFIDKRSSNYDQWYVGIANGDVDIRLFNDHKVSPNFDEWICSEYMGNRLTRKVEKDLIKLGCEGTEDFHEVVHYVYAYLKTLTTDP